MDQVEQHQEHEDSSWVDQVSVVEGMDTQSLEELADRYANVMLRLDEEEARIKEQHKIRTAQIESRRAAFQNRHESRVRVAVASLLEKKGGKKKSLDLASGRLGFRVTPTTAEFTDESVVKRLAENFPPAADVYAEEQVVKVKIDKRGLVGAVNAYAKAHDGQLPEGIILAGGEDKFYVSRG